MLKYLVVLILLFLVSCAPPPEYTLEQKAGQLIIANPPLPYDNITLDQLFDDYFVSGVIYMNWENDIKGMTPAEIKKYTQKLQRKSSFPLFISADIEGGVINRISSFYAIKTSQQYGLEYSQALDKTQYLASYYRDVADLAQVLSGLGLNLNFAPVLDVEKTLNYGVLSKYERCYSTDYQTVSALGEVYVSALEENGVFSTIKHFPGHGHTTCDTFVDNCGVDLSLEEFLATDLVPFQKALQQKPSFVMVGLFSTPFDEENISIHSHAVVTDLLREELGYSGIIITDDFAMGAVKDMDRYNLTINSLKAGADMLLTTNPNDVPLIHHAIVDAVEKGIISEKQINESFARIMKLKEKIS